MSSSYSDLKYSDNFWAREFDNVEPEEILLNVLELLRSKIKMPIKITSGPRTIQKHISIYKSLEKNNHLDGKKWFEAIPWGSRHLPRFGRKLLAVDIKISKPDKEYFLGKDIYGRLKEVEKELNIPLGIGIGNHYCHIDIDRESPTSWTYSY